jgi:hypothetical protein
MFGFIGKAGSFVKEFEGDGFSQFSSPSVIRLFGICYTHKTPNLKNKNKMFIDLDNVGTPPTRISKFFNFTANTGSVFFDSDAVNENTYLSDAGVLIKNLKGIFPQGNNAYVYETGTNIPLTPPKRKYKVDISRPDFINGLYFFGVNLRARDASATNNFVSTPSLDLDLRLFTNLKYISLIEGIHTPTINIKLPNNNILESFYINSTFNTTTLNLVLPSSVKHIGLFGLTTNVQSIIQNCINCEVLLFWDGNFQTNLNTTITGVFDISFMTKLTDLKLTTNIGLTSVILPSGKSDWNSVHITLNSYAISSTISTSIINDMITSNTLKFFNFGLNLYILNRNIVDTDFINTEYISIANNSITGDITLTTPRPKLKQFITSNLSYRAGTQLNSHPNVNITGLTNTESIYLSGSDISNLELPINTTITRLALFDNKLNIATNPNIINQINAMISLTDLRLGNGDDAINPGLGQTVGFGNNVSLTGLINCTIIFLDSCGLTGNLTLPNVSKLIRLTTSGNTGLTNITNLLSHSNTLQYFQTINCTSYTFSITNVFTSLIFMSFINSGITSVDLSGKTIGSFINRMNIYNCSALTQITFPTTIALSTINSGTLIQIYNNPNLSNIINMENINWSATSNNNQFIAYSCSLNITFPLGVNNFIPRVTEIQNNSMNTTNVDATITSIYNNKSKWSVYTTKNLNISGNNAAATGTYQAPVGFVLNTTDGTPASVKEMIYVLVNNYSWTISYN